MWTMFFVNNHLFKYFGDLCEIYDCNRYLVIFMFFNFVLNFTDINMIAAFRYNANEILERFL